MINLQTDLSMWSITRRYEHPSTQPTHYFIYEVQRCWPRAGFVGHTERGLVNPAVSPDRLLWGNVGDKF